jgi:hypothetical protein
LQKDNFNCGVDVVLMIDQLINLGKIDFPNEDMYPHTSGDKCESCLNKMVIEIGKLKEWCLFNRLLVNWDKTYAMYICTARTRKNENIR